MSNPETTASPGRPQVGKIQSDREHSEMLTYHLTVIRQETAKVETAKGDLGRGYTRKYLESLLADSKMPIRELVELERQRARDKLILNHPVYGQQPELFNGPETPTAARDEMLWEMEGYQRGRRGDLNELQDGDPPTFHQAIMRGFRAGQAATLEEYARGAELRKAAETPNADAKPVDLNADGDGDGEITEASIERAKASLGVEDKPKGAALKPAKGDTRVVRADPVH